MYRMFALLHPACLWAGVIFVLTGCASDVERDFDGLRCGDDGSCLPGYVCSPDRICVSEGLASTAGGAGRAASGRTAPRRGDASTVDAAAELTDAGTTSNDAGLEREARPSQAEPMCGGATCDGACVDLQRDASHCGACGMRCEAPTRGSASCEAGRCVRRCAEGLAECAGACVDPSGDGMNCGGCGQVCPAGQQCSQGACAVECPPGREACAGSCVLVASDTQNCGACGNACPAPMNALAVCNAGTCGSSCGPGYTSCGGSCVDLRSDRLNCGTCGEVCPASTGADPICTDSRCGVRCSDGFSNCEGQCVGDAVVESAKLAGLGSLSVCAAFSALQGFTAGLICVLGLSICDNSCVDMNSDENHCGGCDRTCKNKETCVAGSCTKAGK